MSKLHMYTDEYDTVIAYSPEDANAIIIEQWEMDEGELENNNLTEWDDNEYFLLYYDHIPGDDVPDGRIPEETNTDNWKWVVRATVKEWIDLRGRGWFSDLLRRRLA